MINDQREKIAEKISRKSPKSIKDDRPCFEKTEMTHEHTKNG